MKRLMLLMGLLVLTISVLNGCGIKGYENYLKAVEKTGSIERGRSSFAMKVENKFNYENLKSDVSETLKNFEEITINTETRFDWTVNKSIVEQHYEMAGLGNDMQIFINDNMAMMKLAMLGKYVMLDDVAFNKENSNNEYEKMFTKLGKEWTEILKAEDIITGENIIVETKDGNVKTVKYTIKATDEQMKEFYNRSIKALEGSIDEIAAEMVKDEQSFSANDINKYLNKMSLDDFLGEAYIDIDGNIVEQRFTVVMKANDNNDPLLSTKLEIVIKNWDINKEQELNMPDFSKEETIEMSEISKEFEAMFKDK